MKIGYARTSTLDQEAGLAAQLRDLETAGCERVYREQVSSVAQRPELDAALAFVRQGDTLVVTKLDRLARSTAHLLAIAERLSGASVSLVILDLALDTGTPTGKVMLTVLAAIAQFEREMMLERQREGIAFAKAQGKYKGRKPTARAKADQVRALKAEGKGPAEIARLLNIGRASVYRALAG